jgi:hypothetical protein
METIAVLRLASFRPTSSVAKLSALGDDFPLDRLLARMSQRWSFSGARIQRCKIKKKWRAAADEDGHYSFAVAL